jgi:xanthine/CO dehydrogenase XdhC/CoxF family maturation factor
MKLLLVPVLMTLSSGVFAAELYIARGVVSGGCDDPGLINRARAVATQKAMDHFGSPVRVHKVMGEREKPNYGTYWNVCLDKTAIAEISFKAVDHSDALIVEATGSDRVTDSIAKDNAVIKAKLACGTKVNRLTEWRIGGRYWEVTATASFECLEN